MKTLPEFPTGTNTLDEFTSRRFGRRTFDAFAVECDRHDQQLLRVGEHLRSQGYVEPELCRLFGVSELQSIPASQLDAHARFVLPEGRLADLARLLLCDQRMAVARVAELLGPDAMSSLVDLGALLVDDGEIIAAVNLTPLGALLLATDTSRYSPLWPADHAFDDRVMYIGHDSLGLALVAPRWACETALDLCTGSGVQALVAARYSQRVIGVDINPRAIRFARFNASLAGIRNVAFVHGDLYEPVRGQTFDAILANPPFVPMPSGTPGLLYRGGGPSGEDVLRRIVEGVDAHLRPGGRVAIATDLVNPASTLAKVASWRSTDAPPAHLLVLREPEAPLVAYADSQASHIIDRTERGRLLLSQLASHRAHGIESIAFGYILVSRSSGSRATSCSLPIEPPVNRPIHQKVGAMLRQCDALDNGSAEDSTLRLAPGLRVCVETWRDENGAHTRIELRAPDDPFFSRYELTEYARDLVTTIDELRPRWGEIEPGPGREFLAELLAQGVLELVADPAKSDGP